METTFTPEDVKRHVNRLDNRLAGVRRRVGIWFFADGIMRVLLWAAVLFGIDFVIDRFFHMDRPQRMIMLTIMVVTLLVVIYRRIIRPLTTRLTNRAICHEVEKSHPELADRLTTAMELSRHTPTENISKELTDAAIEDGFSVSKGLRFNDMIRRGRFATSIIVSLLVVGGIGTAAVMASPGWFSIWFNRNIMLGDQSWPMEFYLEIPGLEDGEMVVPRGDDWPIEAIVKDGETTFPDELWIELPATEIRMEKQTDGRTFRSLMRKVLEPTEARVVGDGGWSPWFKIRLVNRPEVVDIELVAVKPEYVGEDDEVLPRGQGPYYLLNGSSLRVEGTSTKNLSEAYLIREGTEAHLHLEVDGTGFSGTVPAKVFEPGAYTLALLDTEKVRLPGNSEATPLSSRSDFQFTIRELPDRPPSVKLRLSGVSSMVVPKAVVPIRMTTEDDYAVMKARVDYQWIAENASEGTEPKSGSVELAEPPPFVDDDGKEIPVDPTRRTYTNAIEISELKIPAGSSLTLEGVAADNDTVGGPKEGRSSKVLLRVVTESELRADLLRREKEDRQALEEITKLQDQTFTDTRGVQVATRTEEGVSPENRSQLLKLQKRQKLLSTNITPIIERLSRIIQEYQNNRLVTADGKGLERLQGGAVVHLEVISGQLMPAAALQLETARRLSDNNEEREKAFVEATTLQEQILEKLRLVLRNLEKNEGFQEVLNLLHEIEGSQKRVLDLTDDEKKKRLKGLSEGKEGETPEEKEAKPKDEKLNPTDSEAKDKVDESNPPQPNDKEE